MNFCMTNTLGQGQEMTLTFRGITITSNVGKLFNLIVNSRLDNYLEENNLIDKSQIGFTKMQKLKITCLY